tara:strand:- start:209 stop:379 length:171 start_codon:yes stop_codon:yes gene_type:complete
MTKQSEDTMYRIYHEVKEKKLQRKFDKQIKKMETQEKHKFKEVCEMWEYALKRIQE